MQREACIACKPYVILRPRRLGKALLAGFLALQGVSGAAAERCENPDYRAFDFWIGSWVVELADGRPAGTNRIEASKDGCMLHEHWKGASGGEGYSISFYDPGRDLWRQIWITPDTLIEISGGLESASAGSASGAFTGASSGASMVLTGEIRYLGRDQVRPFRGRWTPLADGRVRQFFEEEREGEWQPWFEGFYSMAVQ